MAWQDAVEQTVTGLGYDLVELERSAGGLLRVTIDLPWDPAQPAVIEQFVTVEDCEKVTRQLQFALEVENVDYKRLEVGSPGIDRPLTRRADFADWAGHEAKVALKEKLNGRQRFNGELVGIDGDTVTISVKEGVEHKLPFDAIDTAKLVLTDKLIAATVPLSIEGADEMEEEGQD